MRMKSEPAPTDRARRVALALVMISLAAIGLHVREVLRTGLWQPPVYAVPGPGADAYPIIGGDTLEIDAGEHGLRPGDRLVKVGERDLRGHGYLGFLGRSYEEADAAGVVSLTLERNGEQRAAQFALSPPTVPWLRVPFLTMIWLLIAFLAWQRPRDAGANAAILAFGSVIVGEAVFEGQTLAQTVAAKTIFILGGAVWWPILTRWLASFPEAPPARSPAWVRVAMVVTALLWVLPKLQYLFGGPTPAPRIPLVVTVADAAGVVAAFGVFGANYAGSDEARRRRLRWVFSSTGAAGLLMVGALLLPVWAPGGVGFSVAIGAAGLAAAAIPFGFLVAMVAHDLFDIDRVISATATYSLMSIAFLTLLLALVPALASWLAPVAGFDEQTTRLALSVATAGFAVPAAQWLGPRIEGLFFPERQRVREGMDRWLAAQTRERDAAGLATLAAREAVEIFGATHAEAFVAQEDLFVRAAPESAFAAARSVPRHALPNLADAEGVVRPLTLGVDRAGRRPSRDGDGEAWPAALPGAALLLPIFEGRELGAFVAVGPKRSGDIYTGAELSLLSANLEAARRQLGHVREEEAHRRERARAESIEASHLTRSRQLATASHDLRQPLYALRLHAEGLEARLGDDEERALASRIRSGAVALHEMFDSLIDLARMDQDRFVVNVESFDVAALLHTLADEGRAMAREKGLGFELDVEPAQVESDRLGVARIVRNLMVNAIRYTDAGEVRLTTREGDSTVTIAVSDTGPGIAPAHRDEIFGEFVRLGDGTDEEGLGLGLSIVKRLAERLDHALDVHSVEGRGSTFSVTLATSAAPRANAEPAVTAPSTWGLAGRRALVVADDAEVLATIVGLLSGWGLDVSPASDADRALDASTAPPDVIVADADLAGTVSGLEIVDRLRSTIGADLPAVVLVADAASGLAPALAQRGIPAVAKPVPPARLRAAVVSVLAAV